MMNLKAIAKTYTTPEGVVFYFIPYQTLQVYVARDEMEKIAPDPEQWDIIQQTITLCLPLLVDVDVPENAPAEYQGLHYYLQNRNGDFRANFALYTQLLSVDVCTRLWEAYNATRDHSLDAPPELQAGAADDPNSKAATSRRRKQS